MQNTYEYYYFLTNKDSNRKKGVAIIRDIKLAIQNANNLEMVCKKNTNISVIEKGNVDFIILDENLNLRKVISEYEIERKNKRQIYMIKRRCLGCKTINKYFDDCNAHHFNKEMIIFVPKNIHQSILHSVLKNRNMIEINSLTFTWLESQ